MKGTQRIIENARREWDDNPVWLWVKGEETTDKVIS